MQPSIMFAGQLLFLLTPLPPFLPIFLRKHSHFRSTPCLPYGSQFVSVADWLPSRLMAVNSCQWLAGGAVGQRFERSL